jgi:hypothetical protein
MFISRARRICPVVFTALALGTIPFMLLRRFRVVHLIVAVCLLTLLLLLALLCFPFLDVGGPVLGVFYPVLGGIENIAPTN